MNSNELNPIHRPLILGAETPVLDVFQIEAVREIMGDELTEIIDAFISSLPQYLEDMRLALAEAKLEAFGRSAHGLKGAAANIGAISLGELAKQMEMAGKSKDAVLAQTLMTRIEGEMQRAMDALRTLT